MICQVIKMEIKLIRLGLKNESGVVYKNVSWVGWKHFIVPLGDVSTWVAVKQIRLTVKSPFGNGVYHNIQLSDISIVGNKWENPTIFNGNTSIPDDQMVVSAINNIDNSGYVPLYDYFSSDYKNLYNPSNPDLTGVREQSLDLKYTLEAGSTATTRSVFSTAADYSKHKELVYYLWGSNVKGATFAIQLGAETAYYEHRIVPNWIG